MLPDRSILIGHKFIKNAKKWPIVASFWKPEVCGQTVLPDILIGQKLVENAKIGQFKCDILRNFQTLCVKICLVPLLPTDLIKICKAIMAFCNIFLMFLTLTFILELQKMKKRSPFNFKWNSNLKITRQIDLVLRYLANEWCNLANFSSEITIWKKLVKLTWFCAI